VNINSAWSRIAGFDPPI